MVSLKRQNIIRKAFRFIQAIIILLTSASVLQQPTSFPARQEETIQTVDLDILIKDIARVEFGYHHSSFESQHIEYKLEIKDGVFTDGKVNVPLSSLAPLLKNLTDMYPGTRPLFWNAWTDDYPHAWVYLHLKDGQVISITSDSQFNGMFPWNVSVWESEKATLPEGSYIQLNQAFLSGMEALWRGVGEDGFPRKPGDDLKWVFGDSIPETINFYNEDSPDTTSILGKGPASLSLFLPLLNQNSEIKLLLDDGYTIYDASFSLDAQTQTLRPVQYSGTLALATPDEKDVVIGLVTLPLEKGKSITTTFNAIESINLVKQRKTTQFLNEANQLLSHLTFLLDTREGVNTPSLECPENNDISLDRQVIQATWNPAEPMRVTFFPLNKKRWSVNLRLQRGQPNWDDTVVKNVLKAWFPESIAELPTQNIQLIDTHWKIAFMPDVTLHDPQFLNRLYSRLPEQTTVHEQNSEKAGDYSYLSLDGRVSISEEGAPSDIVYCGVALPDWYGPEYPIESVIPPNDLVLRQDLPGTKGKNGKWHGLNGLIPFEQFRTNWTSIAYTQPGFLHVLWTNEREGVYYADGWIDGTGWTEPQRLGEDAYWLNMRAWPDGEIHLFWDAGLTTGGSIHVWRPAGGMWQKPEHWPIAYFSEILRDSNGILHIGSIESDGLDGEFMHRTWSPDNGLSNPENISRQIGDTGNTTAILRFDSKGQLHAAWSHILEYKSAPDPITGETPDTAGIFYARQLPDGRWSKPEQIGTLAAYAHAMSMELDEGDNPLIIWQTKSGLVSRIKKNNTWEATIELARITPPETPAEFGPERQVQPTVELQTGLNTQGKIIAGWLVPNSGLKMAGWSGAGWANTVDIVTLDKTVSDQLEPPALKMVVDDQDRVHFVFFRNNRLSYGIYDHEKIEINPLSINYDYYGLPDASLLVDTAGSITVLGLPRSPRFEVKIPSEGIPPTPFSIPTLTQTPLFAPAGTLTPIQHSNNYSGFVSLIIGLGILFTSIVIGVAVMRFKKNHNKA